MVKIYVNNILARGSYIFIKIMIEIVQLDSESEVLNSLACINMPTIYSNIDDHCNRLILHIAYESEALTSLACINMPTISSFTSLVNPPSNVTFKICRLSAFVMKY